MKNHIQNRFNENLIILKNKNHSLYKEVINCKDKISIINAKNGLPTYRYRGVYIESRVSPGLVDKKKYFSEKQGSNKNRDFIFLGSGLSYHINELLKEANSNANWSAVLIEKEVDIFTAALFIINPGILKKLTLIIGKKYEDVIEGIQSHDFSRTKVIKHPFSTKLNREYYNRIDEYIQERIKEDVASNITTKVQQELWIRNTLRNIKNIRSKKFFSTGDLAGSFNGPVILIASGPSVDDIIVQLKRVKNYVPIIALLPSYRLLSHNNILPDALFTTDPGFWNKERFVYTTNIPLFTTFSVNPIITENWRGRVFYFNHGLEIEKEFKDITGKNITVPMQGTSSIVMILFARLLGFNPIYLAGFDFCSIGLKDHHSGGGFDRYLILESNRVNSWYSGIADRFKKEGIKKVSETENIYTTYKLMLYKSWLEKWIAGKDLYNASEIWPVGGVRKIDLKVIENNFIKCPTDMESDINSGIESMGQGRLIQFLLKKEIMSLPESNDLEYKLDDIVKKAKRLLINYKHGKNSK